jgi:hypothetical protein
VYGLTDPSAEQAVMKLDADEAGPGYTCFGGPGTFFGVSFLAAWAPGTGATTYPEGTGIRAYAGRKAVVQVHYNLEAGAAPDRTSIAWRFAPKVDHEAFVMPSVDLDLNLPPGAQSVSVSSESTANQAYKIHGVFPHMHLAGRQMRVDRIRGADTSCIVDVPRWSFHWQEFHFYDQPIDVRPGDVARITCTYDTTGRTKTTTFGEGTEDEMCLAGFYLTTD